MKIEKFVWNEDNIFHIARHNVSPEEIEEACYLSPLVLKTRSGRYIVLGQSESGRCLTIVCEYCGKKTIKVITARDMDHKERKHYKRR